MVELRRKNKPVSAEIKPPADPEEWIARANADGAASQILTEPTKSSGHKKAKAAAKRPESKMDLDKPKRLSSLRHSPPSSDSRYISFAIDSITLKLFRELCFTLDKGNTATLAQIIEIGARMKDQEFQSFPDSDVIIGNAKRTMSFLLPQHSLETISVLSKRLRMRNRSALYRYLIQLVAIQFNLNFNREFIQPVN